MSNWVSHWSITRRNCPQCCSDYVDTRWSVKTNSIFDCVKRKFFMIGLSTTTKTTTMSKSMLSMTIFRHFLLRFKPRPA